jgi:acyl-coenzyme A synthetase/AMP-(fatty) acid ligase
MPKTATGKVQRRIVADVMLAREAAEQKEEAAQQTIIEN